MPPDRFQTWAETRPLGPPLCALCIGNDKYAVLFGPLVNCATDAKHVAERVRSVSGASATLLCNLKDRTSMQGALEDFLDKIHHPPQMVLIYFSGHGVQEGDAIFLVPTGASPSSDKELREQCLSHDDVFRILKKKLEDKKVPNQGMCLGSLFYLKVL